MKVTLYINKQEGKSVVVPASERSADTKTISFMQAVDEGYINGNQYAEAAVLEGEQTPDQYVLNDNYIEKVVEIDDAKLEESYQSLSASGYKGTKDTLAKLTAMDIPVVLSALNGLPQTNLTWNDIRDTLNANGGVVSNDAITAFKTTTNINWASKHKPVKLRANFCQDFNSGAANYDSDWWKASDGNCGIIFPEYEGYDQVIKGYDGDKNGWSYELPSGGEAEPFRLADFSEYYPHALSPTGDLDVTPKEINSTESVEIMFTGIFTTWNEKGLKLSDIGDLANRYCGVVVGKKDNTGYISGRGYITVDKKVSEVDVSNVSIDFKYSWSAGTWVFFPVLCKNKQTSFGGAISNTFIPYTGECIEISVSDSYGTNIFISGQAWESEKKVTWSVMFQCNSISATTWSNIQVQLRSTNGGQFANATIANQSLGAGQRKTVEGTWISSQITNWDNLWTELLNNRLYVEIVCSPSNGPSTRQATVVRRP